MSAERWKALAVENKKDKLNFMDSADVRNRAFAVYLHKNTGLLLKDDDGNFITSARVTSERKRKE